MHAAPLAGLVPCSSRPLPPPQPARLPGYLQDSWAIMERIGGQDVLMLGVFDGHGSEGQGVSSCIAQKLPRSLDKSALLKVRGAVQHV